MSRPLPCCYEKRSRRVEPFSGRERSSKRDRQLKHRKELAAAGKATSGEGVKATRLASRVALTPSPLRNLFI